MHDDCVTITGLQYAAANIQHCPAAI